MWSGNFAPNDAHLRFLSLLVRNVLPPLALVNKSGFLSNVEEGIKSRSAALDLEKGGVFALIPQTPLVPGEHSLGVQSAGLPHDAFGFHARTFTFLLTKSLLFGSLSSGAQLA